MKTKVILLSLFLVTTIFAQEPIQSFISLKNTGVKEFLDKYPEYDGRGTIVMILDTGIDMGIDGLTKTSTGEDKVIDVQDFTGQGDVQLFDAEVKNVNDSSFFINSEKEYQVAGADKLSLQAKDDKYYIGLITEKRWMNSGSRVRDLNGNGTTDDKFYIVAFETENNGDSYWVAYFDADSDGDISNNQPTRNYKEKHDVIKIKNETGLTYFTIALNIFPDEKKVVLFFDDGSHGTHCAGIAAGYSIGETSLNGVAPGAYLMGLKLGNNTLSGGATVTESMKKAYLYADKISKEREEPCIINMSFGIGSEIEGHADFEIFLADLVKDNPYLYIATSNGNEGPGISTTGLPAASTSVLSSGAVLAQEIGNDLYGTVLDRDIILHFSSRGGEVPKPDVVSPGAATSTVPNFAGGDRFWGTSMASPYSAGVLSLLLSAAKVEFPDVKIPSRLLYKVIRESAVPMEGYVKIDQGGGLINVVNAFELLKKYIAAGEISNFETYTVSAFAPNMPDAVSSSMYVRNGTFITGDENFSFSVTKDDNNKTTKFYRLFNLRSDSDWLVPITKQTRIRNNHQATINYRLDKTKMTDVGMYNGTITAYDSKTNIPAFEMMATVVIPYQFTSANNYSHTWKNETVSQGMHKRYFLEVPPGASTMRIKLSSDSDQFTSCRMYLHAPDGEGVMFGMLNAKNEDDDYEKYFYPLEPGVYEFVVLGQFTAKEVSSYDLNIEFKSIDRVENKILDYEEKSIDIVNTFNKVDSYTLSGKILGYQRNYSVFLDSVETYDIPFTIKREESAKLFNIKISKDDFNKLTDFAVLIYDENGKALSSDGLSYSEGSISIKNKFSGDETNLKLTLVPAYTNKAGQMNVNIKETTYMKKGVTMKVTNDYSRRIMLYPSVQYKLSLNYLYPNFTMPDDAVYYGKIYFKSPNGEKTEYELPIQINK